MEKWTERQVEAHLSDVVAKAGGLTRKWFSPGHRGVPDRLVILPGGRVAACELKRDRGGALSRLQLRELEILARLGLPVVVVGRVPKRQMECLGAMGAPVFVELELPLTAERVQRWFRV